MKDPRTPPSGTIPDAATTQRLIVPPQTTPPVSAPQTPPVSIPIPPPAAPIPSAPQSASNLIAAHVTGPFAQPPASVPGGATPVVQYPQPGTVLTSPKGSYTVNAVIGAGEFGAVYECIGPFDQVYAVKLMRPANRAYADVHAEWLRECQRLLSLRHPNVVYIHDAFTQNHLFFLALERCDHALTAMLGTPMQEGLVLELARQLLAAVQFLHDNDVVHDDLHPGNVLITHTDRPTVKISDFGISHELRGAPAIRPNVVHHRIMAPEILATGYTSKQSDLYQIGLLLYWMLTGESAILQNAPYQELVQQVAEGLPRQKAEAVGTPLGQLIAKMLRRRDAYRYTSAREVWAELRDLPAWRERELFPVK